MVSYLSMALCFVFAGPSTHHFCVKRSILSLINIEPMRAGNRAFLIAAVVVGGGAHAASMFAIVVPTTPYPFPAVSTLFGPLYAFRTLINMTMAGQSINGAIAGGSMLLQQVCVITDRGHDRHRKCWPVREL